MESPGRSLPKRRAREGFSFLRPERKDGDKESYRGGIKLRERWERARCTEEELQDRSTWAVAVSNAERGGDSRPRGTEALRERACPLEKTGPTSGPVLTVTQVA